MPPNHKIITLQVNIIHNYGDKTFPNISYQKQTKAFLFWHDFDEYWISKQEEYY